MQEPMTTNVTELDTMQRTGSRAPASVRHDWTREQALALYELPFMELMFRAQTQHRQNFDPNNPNAGAVV